MQKEIDYSIQLIKRLTPYLNKVTYPKYHRDKGHYDAPMTLKQRAFSWYYVYNGGNKSDAFRRAFYSDIDNTSNKLVPMEGLRDGTIAAGGYRVYKKVQVQKAIQLIRDSIEKKIKTDIPQSLLEQLQVQASYDPSMFITASGEPTFKDWEEIPLKYRCCVVGIEKKHYGSFGQHEQIVIKLADRNKARKELQALVPDLVQTTQVDMRVQHIGADGKPIAADYTHLSDAELLAIAEKADVI